MSHSVQISTSKFPSFSATIYGEGNEISVVLIHGFPADSSLWRKVIPLLAKQYQLIVPDLPGVGNSSIAAENFSMDDLAEALSVLLKAQQIDKAIIAGHSMGGYMAMAYADAYPEAVLGLAMIHSSAMADNDEKIKNRKKAISLIQKGGKDAFIEAMLPGLFTKDFREKHPEELTQQRSQALSVAPEVLTAFYNAMINRPDGQNVLRTASYPLLWVCGAEDPLIPPAKTMQQTSLGFVNFVEIYNNSAHMAMLECPDRLAVDLDHFASYCYAKQTAHLSA